MTAERALKSESNEPAELGWSIASQLLARTSSRTLGR